MSVTITVQGSTGEQFEITAGSTDNHEQRHVSIGVPGTCDIIRLDWKSDADFSAGPMPVALRIGTLGAQQAELEKSILQSVSPPVEPAFGPDGQTIVRNVVETFVRVVASGAKFTLSNKTADATNLATSVAAQYLAVGSALGTYIHGQWPPTAIHGRWPPTAIHGRWPPTAIEIGAVLSALASLSAYVS